MTNPILEVRNLSKHFPVTRGFFKQRVATCRAVDGVSFSLNQGEVLGIVGESGCGKSTLARAAIRLIEPSGGEIHFRGQSLCALSRRALRNWRPKAQLVFQNPLASLNPRRTVGENIQEAALYHGVVPSHELSAAVQHVLERVGLPPNATSRFPHQFSGGQQQRICIARALLLNPDLLICDEAVSALDVSVQAQILNLLAKLRDSLGLSILFISHDLGVIRHLCDRILVLYLGKVVESAPADELFANPKHPYTQVLLSAIPKQHPNDPSHRVLLSGDPPSPLNPPKGCPFHTRCPVAEPNCALAVPPLKTGNLAAHTYRCIRD